MITRQLWKINDENSHCQKSPIHYLLVQKKSKNSINLKVVPPKTLQLSPSNYSMHSMYQHEEERENAKMFFLGILTWRKELPPGNKGAASEPATKTLRTHA